MCKSDRIRLQHMRDAAREAIGFAADRSREALDADRMLVLALVKALEIVGEAAGQVSEETRARVPDIPWADIAGMRNRLVHAYFDINLEIVWQTIRQDLPPLVEKLESAIHALASDC